MKILLVILLLFSCGNAIKLESFNSSGVYFKYLGNVKIQIGAHLLWNPINITNFELAASKYKKNALMIKDKCAVLGLNCSEQYSETETKVKELNDRMDRIYELLGERRQTRFLRRRRRGWCILFCSVPDNSGAIRDLRATINSNFQNVQNALRNQKNMIQNLNDQNKEIKSTLQAHQSQINEAAMKINELINVTKTLKNDIQKNEVIIQFNKLNQELSEIQAKVVELQKIIEDVTMKNYVSPQVMTAEDLLDNMMLHPLKDRFLYSPVLPNYPKILKALKTFAIVGPQEGIISVIIALPLFSLEAIKLYEPLTLPIISNKKVVIIDNKFKYCAITEDMEKYNCGKDLDSTIQSNGEFYLTDEIGFPLYNALKGDQCLINIFRGTSIDNCKFKYLNENIEIFHNLDGDRYIYAVRDKTKYFFECGAVNNYNRNDIINGTGFLELDKGCEFSTDNKESVHKAKLAGSTSEKTLDKYEFELDEQLSEKLGNLTIPKDFVPLKDKEILMKLSELNERGVFFVPETHWFIKFLHSKVFHSIVTIAITLAIIAGLVYCFVYLPKFVKMRNNVMLRVQSYRIRRRVVSAPPEADKLKVTRMVAFYEEQGKEDEPLELYHVKKTKNKKNKRKDKRTEKK